MTDANLAQERDTWASRAQAWELLARSFSYPEPDLARALASGEWLETACELAERLGAVLPDNWDEGLEATAGGDEQMGEDLHALRREATRLFFSPEGALVSPYEGSWAADRNGVQALAFISPSAMAVERFAKECGLGRPKGTNETLDVIGTELELLEYLAALAARQPEGCDAEAQRDLPGGSAHTAHDLFLDQHAATWMDDFASRVAQTTAHPFYRAAAHLLAAFLQAARTASCSI